MADFFAGNKAEEHPSANAGMRWAPLMACPGLRKVKAYLSVDSTKPILGRRPTQSLWRYQPGSMPNHWTYRKSIWVRDHAIPSSFGCVNNTIAWKIPITQAYQYSWALGPVSGEVTITFGYVHVLMVSTSRLIS
jgi:hypothetical protein